MMNPGRSLFGLIPILLVGTFLISGCQSGGEEIADQTPLDVQVQHAEKQIDQNGQMFPAQVESKNQANLSTIVMGTVTQTEVNVGDRVQKGDVLLRIKDDQITAQKRQLEANMVQAQANLDNTEKNYNRIKNLYAEESATSKEMDDISTMYEIAKANMEALRASLREVNEMLNYTVIRAPFDGIVSKKFVNEGDMAAPGHPLVAVSNPGQIKITANIPEQLINSLEEGSQVTITVPAAGLNLVPAKIYAVSQAADRASRQYAVEAQLTEKTLESNLKTGMFAEMYINMDDSETLFIPKSAIVQRGQLTGIYTLSSDNLAMLRWVRTGKSSGERIEIISGLKAGETFVTDADQKIRQGQLLNLRQ